MPARRLWDGLPLTDTGTFWSQAAGRPALQARQAAAPASLSYRRAPLPDGLSVNRRGLPYSPWLALLDICSEGGDRIGVLANLAVHPVALGPECYAVSADWVAPFRAGLEAEIGGSAVMLSGALGDVNPRHVHREFNACAGDGFAEADGTGSGTGRGGGSRSTTAEIMTSSSTMIRSEDLTAPVGQPNALPAEGRPTTAVELVEWSWKCLLYRQGVPRVRSHEAGSAQYPVILAGLCPTWNGYLPVPFTRGTRSQMSFGRSCVLPCTRHSPDRTHGDPGQRAGSDGDGT